MKTPKISVSWGELFDKMTILEIKLENLKSKSSLKNVKKEHNQLRTIFDQSFLNNTNADRLIKELRLINQSLWKIEDKVRDKERIKTFDNDFIELARSVYLTNDERSRIKNKINYVFGSELVEEKSYTNY